MALQWVSCVPNFSEGRNLTVIKSIADEIQSVKGIKLLEIDPGYDANRTVITFAGSPEDVTEAAFRGIKRASELIDMSQQSGVHPRMGATDVCPMIPLSGMSAEDLVPYANKLAERVGTELGIPVFLYAQAATKPEREKLENIRSGEYEGLKNKLTNPMWKPDFGSSEFNAKSGATAIGVRDFLLAYNVNLDTKSEEVAHQIACDVRESGRAKTDQNGKIVRSKNGNAIRIPGKCQSVKGLGWYIEEYGQAQVSMNLTNLKNTPIHLAFEECKKSAEERGVKVTGSELIGLAPKFALVDAGKYFSQKQGDYSNHTEREWIDIAIKNLGLADLKPFNPEKKIIEYRIENAQSDDISWQLSSSNSNKIAEQ